MAFLKQKEIDYRIYPKYWDTLTPYHTCLKIWNSLFNYPLMCLKYCGMYGKQSRPWSDTAFCGVWSLSSLFAIFRVITVIRLWLNVCKICGEPKIFKMAYWFLNVVYLYTAGNRKVVFFLIALFNLPVAVGQDKMNYYTDCYCAERPRILRKLLCYLCKKTEENLHTGIPTSCHTRTVNEETSLHIRAVWS